MGYMKPRKQVHGSYGAKNPFPHHTERCNADFNAFYFLPFPSSIPITCNWLEKTGKGLGNIDRLLAICIEVVLSPFWYRGLS